MTTDNRKARSIFLAAVENHPPQQWQTFLDQVCAGDSDLRARVEVLLQGHAAANSLLDRPSPGLLATVDEPITERPGTVIGSYKLMEQVGEGGMGLVFVAEQQHPIRRKVALKVIKPGMDTRQVIARFEAERQALALMDHPNIAKVLDGGETASGRPYFVMELVKGVPITEYCDQNQIPIRERLHLFPHVCQAVQHAHQKSIIHRDIKPSNVLVMSHDGKPVVRVIDFGVAKAIGQHLTEKTLYTHYAQLIGTPLYMSPEQAGQSGLDVDTRSDIYSLGVLLYELLTGMTPFDKERFKEAGYDEIRRIIREEEPPRPSTRICTMGQASTSISTQRKSDPRTLSQLIRGELDWIVMKALEKDRNRRYETASAFATDVQRYLNDEPVQACPPSAWYSLRKFAKRHRAGVATGALITAILLMSIVVLAVTNAWITQEKKQKEQALAQAMQAEALARKEEQTAKAMEAAARATVRFFQDYVLSAARPKNQPGGLGVNASIRAALDAAEPRIAKAFAQQPGVEVGVRNTLGITYRGLGEAALAKRQHEQALALSRTYLGPGHSDTLVSMEYLGMACVQTGELERAEALFKETLAQRLTLLGPDHPDTLAVKGNLALAYQATGRLADAVTLLEQVVEVERTKFGSNTERTLTHKNNLGRAYLAAGKLEQAVSILEQAYTPKSKELPALREAIAHNLSTAYLHVGKTDLALPLLEQAVEKFKAILGPDHPDLLTSLNNLAWAYQQAGKLDQAVLLFEQILDKCKARLGDDHPQTLNSMNNLATAYRDAGRLGEAEPLFRQAVEGASRRLGSSQVETVKYSLNLGACYVRMRQFAKAEPLLRDCLVIREERQPGSWELAMTQSLLGEALAGQRKDAEAELLLLAGYEGLKAHEQMIPVPYRNRLLNEAVSRLVQYYESVGQTHKAAQWRVKLETAKQGKKKLGS
jgi:serine/threonine protein kinase/Flp pilus assembly protein TadD